jgi:hypothetical protein
MGDLIAAMAGIREVCKKYNSKAKIYQRLDMPAGYYEGAKHPTKDSMGVQVCMNKKMFELIKPLIEHQSYVESFEIWQGEKVMVDLDRIRHEKVNMPYGDIRRWYYYLFPDMACDLSEAWIEVPETEKQDFVIINRTERYTNPHITYHFLKDSPMPVYFAGTDNEYNKFCKEFEIPIIHLQVSNFLELAKAIKSSKVFIGNQSFCYNLAEAIKQPLILELCNYAPNCIPYGKHGFDFYYQQGLEYYFNQLVK